MKYYKTFKKKGLIGVQNLISREVIIPAEYNKIEIFCNKYFECVTDNKRKVLNANNRVVFEFNNQKSGISYEVDKVIYKVMHVEEKRDTLTYYGENEEEPLPKMIKLIKIEIKNNKVKELLTEF